MTPRRLGTVVTRSAVARKACAVERTRCTYCRNPIKTHQAAIGPKPDDRSFHQDCWPLAQNAPTHSGPEQQLDYERRIAVDGLAAVLSPYVTVLPAQRQPALAFG